MSIEENILFNPEHYEIVKKGKKGIDSYRKEHPRVSFELDGADLSSIHLENADLTWVDPETHMPYEVYLRKAKLGSTFLEGANLGWAHMEEAFLIGAHLSGGNLFAANLDRANLLGAQIDKASLGSASLKETLLGSSDLSGSIISGANLEKAYLRGVNLEGADLRDANLDAANLTEVYLDKKTSFEQTIFNDCIFSIDESVNKKIAIKVLSKGIVNNIQFIDPVFGRKVRDEAWLNKWKKSSKVTKYFLGPLWKISSNYGRSMLLWALWCAIFVLLFACIYFNIGIREFGLSYPDRVDVGSFFTWIYFSVVTFVTLGYGDITPTTLTGMIPTVIEVILGYIMLGGLVSILANKLSRRND